MKNVFLRVFILIGVMCLRISSGFSQVMEWPDGFVSETSEMPLHIMYLMGGEYNKAIIELENETLKVAQQYGTNSLDYLNLQYHQWVSYHHAQYKTKAAQIRAEMQAKAYRLPKDSLLKHLLYKSWLDTQFYSASISGATMTEMIRGFDDPILQQLGEVSVLDPQAYYRKIAAGFEVMQKYEKQEGSDDQIAQEMYGAMHGEKKANDLTDLMKFAEEGKGLSNEEAIQQLLKMGDNSLISSYLPLLKGLQGMDEDSSLGEILTFAGKAVIADREATSKGINQLTTPIGYQAKETIGRKEFEEKMQKFNQLNGEEKKRKSWKSNC